MADKKKESPKQDTMTPSMQNNPCGICRASGKSPPCPGHAKGGDSKGGSGGSSDVEKEDKNSLANTPFSTKPTPGNNSGLHPEFDDGQYWQRVTFLENAVSYKNPDALIYIQIEGDKGVLSLGANKNLSSEELKEVQKLFDKIKGKFEAFRDELENQGIDVDGFKMSEKEGSLTIEIPDKHHFANFIQQLMSQNLLPTKTMLGKTLDNQQEHKSDKKRSRPSPFSDIDKGPRPKGH